MSDMQDLARRAMAAKTIADEIKRIGFEAKDDLLDLMAQHGSERLRVTDENGTDFGTASLCTGREIARINDPDAFLGWVAERYPEQIIRAVNPDWQDRLLSGVIRKGATVDDEGELIPGVEVVKGGAYLTVRPSVAARQRAVDLLAAHLPAIGSSD